MPTLQLDPASLQALRDLVDATKKSTTTQRQSQQQAQAQQMQLSGIHSTLHTGNTYGAANNAQLQNLSNLQMGQAMGMKLWQNPVNGQMSWVPGGNGSGGAGGGPKGGGGSKGMLAKMGLGGLSRFAAPLAIAHTVGNAASSIGEIVHDKYMGGAAAERKFFRDVVPFGGTMQGWVDNISGRTAAMEQNKITHETLTGRAGLDTEKFGLASSMQPQLQGARSYAQAFHSQTAATVPVLDRSTASGEQAYKDAARVLPLRQESLRAEREMKKAVAERSVAEVAANDILKKRFVLETEMAETRKKRDQQAGVDTVKYNAEAVKLDAMQKQYDELRGTQHAAESGLHEKRAAQAAAEGNYAKAKLREDKLGRAEILQGQAERAKGTAASLGAMNPLERAQAAQAVLIGKEHGIDALPPEMKAMFQQLAPREFEAAAVKAGAASAEFGQLQGAGVVDAPGGRTLFGANVGTQSPAKLQERADALRKEAAEGEFEQDSKTAGKQAEAGDRMADVVNRAIDAAISQMERKIEDKVRMLRNQ